MCKGRERSLQENGAAWMPLHCLMGWAGHGRVHARRGACMGLGAGVHGQSTVAAGARAAGHTCVQRRGAVCVLLHPKAQACAGVCTTAGAMQCVPGAGRGYRHTRVGGVTPVLPGPTAAARLQSLPAPRPSGCPWLWSRPLPGSPPLAPPGTPRAGCGHPFTAGTEHARPLPTAASPPGAAQGQEKSLGASAQSATLSNLRPDTEYVVMLRPRYTQQPSGPSTLTARTRKR